MEQLGSCCITFDIWVFFKISLRKFKFHQNLKRVTGICSILLRMRNVSVKSCREHQTTHFIFNKLFQKSCHFWEDVEKYYTARQATDDNMAVGHCMMDKYDYKHTLKIWYIYSSSTATTVAQMWLNTMFKSTFPVLFGLLVITAISCFQANFHLR